MPPVPRAAQYADDRNPAIMREIEDQDVLEVRRRPLAQTGEFRTA